MLHHYSVAWAVATHWSPGAVAASAALTVANRVHKPFYLPVAAEDGIAAGGQEAAGQGDGVITT